MQLARAVVTGAGSGIGRAVAAALAGRGLAVAVTDLDEAAARETAAGLGAGAAAYAMDVADRGDVRAAREQIEADGPAPTVVVNNAGFDVFGPFLDSDPAVWARLVAVNLLGQMHVAQEFAPGLVAAGGGRIVNVASDAGRVGSSGESVYAGAKGGVIAFTKSLARELARHGVTVNCVCPGPTETPLLAAMPAGYRDALVRSIPLRRFAQPADVAAAVAFFASAEAGYITGQVLSVSGGLTMSG